MERPLDIAFLNMRRDAVAEEEIRQHVERLETRFGRLIGCRVSIEALHQEHRTGNAYVVRITMSVPGKDLVISHEPHHHKDRHARPNAHTVIHDSFKAAERLLDSHSAPRHERSATVSSAALSGRVLQIEHDADHGFLLGSAGTQIYFHRNSVTGGCFDTLQTGDSVHYVEAEGDLGPIAKKVRLGAQHRVLSS